VPNEDPTYEKQTVLETMRYSHMDGCISSNTFCPKMPAAETFLYFKKGAGCMGRQPSDNINNHRPKYGSLFSLTFRYVRSRNTITNLHFDDAEDYDDDGDGDDDGVLVVSVLRSKLAIR